MKSVYLIAVFGILVLGLLVAGCTQQVQAPPTITVTPTPTPTPVPPPFPNAIALNSYANYGGGDRQAEATVYAYKVLANYNWTSPMWNSPFAQVAAGPSGVEYGYNTETPHAGNTFLFVWIKIINTGKYAMYVPGPNQWTVFTNGVEYNQSAIPTPQVTIDQIPGKQYTDLVDSSGTTVVQPGASNDLDGYLIYEIPSSFDPTATYVACNLDFINQTVWKLA